MNDQVNDASARWVISLVSAAPHPQWYRDRVSRSNAPDLGTIAIFLLGSGTCNGILKKRFRTSFLTVSVIFFPERMDVSIPPQAPGAISYRTAGLLAYTTA